MSFAAVLELVTLVTFLVVVLGGKQKRETGWKVLAFMLMLVGVTQCAAMAIVVCCAPSFPQIFFQTRKTGGEKYCLLLTNGDP